MAQKPKLGKIGEPSTANEEYLDASLRHQIGIRQFSTREVKDIVGILERSDQQLAEKLRRSLTKFEGRTGSFKTQRFSDLLRSVRDHRDDAIGQMRMKLAEDMRRFARIEADFEVSMLKASLPVDVSFSSVPTATLRALVTQQPFSGGTAAARTLNQWFKGLQATDQARLVEAIQLGVIQGETVPEMMRRVIGTRANSYADGVLAMSRRNAEAVVRTAVNHVSNAAREEVWNANSDIIAGFKWVSTLDGRTSAICRARDGHVAPMEGKEDTLPSGLPRLKPANARPPAHPNCRSVMVAILDGEDLAGEIGERPFVRDADTRRKREINFRDQAKKKAGQEEWSSMTPKQRNAAISDVREAWGRRAVGRVPNDVSYDEWLRRQPVGFQEEVLGKKKAALFREGGLKMDQFVDARGKEISLDDLAKQNPRAWMRAEESIKSPTAAAWAPELTPKAAEQFVKGSAFGSERLFHFTSAQKAAGIAESGFKISDGNFGKGIYLTRDKTGESIARAFGIDTKLEVVTNARNPLEVRGFSGLRKWMEKNAPSFDEPMDALKVSGYDSLVVKFSDKPDYVVLLDKTSASIVSKGKL